MATATSRITPRRIEEARAAYEQLSEEGIHCDWMAAMRVLRYFFEDMAEETKEAAHE